MPFPAQWLQYWWSFEQFDLSAHRCRSLLWFVVANGFVDTPTARADLITNGNACLNSALSGLSNSTAAAGNHPSSYMNMGSYWFHAGLSGVVPTVATDTLPATMCICANLETADRSRNGMGRIFISGISNGDVVDDHLRAGVATFYETALSNLITGWSAGGAQFQLGVVSYQLARILPVTRIRVSQRVAVLRKRISKHNGSPFLTPKAPPP